MVLFDIGLTLLKLARAMDIIILKYLVVVVFLEFKLLSAIVKTNNVFMRLSDVTLNMVWLGLQRYGSVFYWLHQRTSYDESWPIEFGRDLSADFHARLYYDPPRIYDTTQHHVFHPFCQIWH